MAHLTVEQAREISLAAASAILGEPVDVEVVPGADHTGDDAWFITYRFVNADDRARAATWRLDISLSIGDELVRRGDESFPYVTLATASQADRQHDLAPV